MNIKLISSWILLPLHLSIPLYASAKSETLSLRERIEAAEETHSFNLSELRSLAQKGDAKAQDSLGSHYATGIGIEKNLNEAFR